MDDTMNQPPQSGWNWTTTTTPAISLRAYIATAALQGILARQPAGPALISDAVKYADALIAELEKEGK